MLKNTLNVNLKPLVKGALTFIPGMTQLLPEGGGGTASPSYCYGVWLKHLAMLWRSGMRSIPPTLAELGPGSSLGTGLAAMLSGVDHYRALDVVKHSSIAANLRVFDELVDFFRARAPRPRKGWPDFDDYLDASLFPRQILSDELLAKTLAPERIAMIRRAISDPDGVAGEISIRYIAPWDDENTIEKNSVELIISHAVLGEVMDLERAYRALTSWLKPGGFMSHQIGMAFEGFNGKWNGYWACPEALWKVIKGRRPFMVNRQPVSVHLELLRQQNLDIVCQLGYRQTPANDSVSRSQLWGPWKNLSDDDFQCSSLFVQAKKPMPASVQSAAEASFSLSSACTPSADRRTAARRSLACRRTSRAPQESAPACPARQ